MWTNSYHLLPFNFDKFGSDEIIVNMFGDFVIAPCGTATKIAIREKIDDILFDDLIANNIISRSKIPKNLEVLATRYRTKKAFLEDFTSLHIIVMTIECNQSCVYCQVSSRNVKDRKYQISDADLKKSIDLIFKSPSKYITIEFQGGEPLLAFQKIKKAVEYSRDLNEVSQKNIQFVICSNAQLLDESIIEYMRENNILLSTSIDGPEHIHNKNRIYQNGNGYRKTVEGINRAKASLGIEQISALMTTTVHSLKYPKEIVDEYICLGFNSVFFREINPFGYAVNNPISDYSTEDFLDFYKTGFEYILDLNKKGIFFVEDFAAVLLKKILTPFNTGFVDLQSPAGLINSVLVYNYDGNIYSSDESRMMAESNDHYFKIAHVGEDYLNTVTNPKVMEIAKNWSNESLAGCSDCAYNVYCGADPVRNYTLGKDLYGFRPSSSFCKKNKSIIRYLIEKSLEKENYQIFQNWLAN